MSAAMKVMILAVFALVLCQGYPENYEDESVVQELREELDNELEKRDGQMPGVLRFGKRSPAFYAFKKRLSPVEKKEMPGVLRFGKRNEKKSVPGVLRFGKRSDMPGVLRFGKRSDMPGVLRFGKRSMDY